MPTSALPNEFRLLVTCSWAPPEPLQAAQRGEEMERLCRAGIDWAAFLALVNRHQVPALVVQALDRGHPGCVPAPVWQELRPAAAKARVQSLLTAAKSGRIARALAAGGIEALPLKGGPLSASLYGDRATRHTRDVDILVRESQTVRAGNVLASLGYQPALPPDGRRRDCRRCCAVARTPRHTGMAVFR